MARHENIDWDIVERPTEQGASLAVLMDIRDELKRTNRHLSALEDLARCVNVSRGFIAMNKLRLFIERRFPMEERKPRKPR